MLYVDVSKLCSVLHYVDIVSEFDIGKESYIYNSRSYLHAEYVGLLSPLALTGFWNLYCVARLDEFGK